MLACLLQWPPPSLSLLNCLRRLQSWLLASSLPMYVCLHASLCLSGMLEGMAAEHSGVLRRYRLMTCALAAAAPHASSC